MTTPSAASEILATKFSPLHLLLSLAFCGCSAAFNIHQNLAEGQIIDPVVLRKPSLEKTIGIFSKYDNFLEGYVTGGIVEPDGRALQGAAVRVTDITGNAAEGFDQGVTDQDGMYKVHFSLPILWNRVDFTGAVAVDDPWKVIAPKPQFVIRYVGKAGILAYYAKPMWIPVKNMHPPKIETKTPPPPIKKPADSFGNLDFGQ